MRLSATPRRSYLAAVAIAGVLILTLSACSSSSTSSAKPSSSAKAGASASPTPTAVANFPTVKGAYGVKPTITFPFANPSTKLQVKVLSVGTGPVVAKNTLMAADYYGQIWRGKAFDNSYDRKQPIGTPIGAGQVLAGWDTGLVGKKIGSRVELVIPPSEGYGTTGSPNAGIKGTDTLVFVIDIIATYTAKSIGDTAAVPQKVSTAPITVTGALGARPKVTVAKGAKLVATAKATVLDKGKGALVKAGLIVLQYEAVYYSGALLASTYVTGFPDSSALGIAGQTNPFDTLIGVPIGSRVLIVTPVQSKEGATTSAAIVADVVAEAAPAKAK